MQLRDQVYLFSATDLVGFLEAISSLLTFFRPRRETRLETLFRLAVKDAIAYAPPSNDVIEADISAFAKVLRGHYGPRLHGVFLFGSRARGEAGSDSDVDIAVVLDEVSDFWKEMRMLSHLSYDFFLRDSVDIEAKPVSRASWDDPARDVNPSLILAMKRDGRNIAGGP